MRMWNMRENSSRQHWRVDWAGGTYHVFVFVLCDVDADEADDWQSLITVRPGSRVENPTFLLSTLLLVSEQPDFEALNKGLNQLARFANLPGVADRIALLELQNIANANHEIQQANHAAVLAALQGVSTRILAL
jgi:hypothetical protein